MTLLPIGIRGGAVRIRAMTPVSTCRPTAHGSPPLTSARTTTARVGDACVTALSVQLPVCRASSTRMPASDSASRSHSGTASPSVTVIVFCSPSTVTWALQPWNGSPCGLPSSVPTASSSLLSSSAHGSTVRSFVSENAGSTDATLPSGWPVMVLRPATDREVSTLGEQAVSRATAASTAQARRSTGAR